MNAIRISVVAACLLGVLDVLQAEVPNRSRVELEDDASLIVTGELKSVYRSVQRDAN